MKLQKVNPNELVIFSMVWREINRVMESSFAPKETEYQNMYRQDS